MSIAATLWQNRDELVHAFHIATIHGIISTWSRCENLKTTPQEPDFVAGLVVESTPLIYSVLNSILSSRGISVSMLAVFCHQTPQVTFGSYPTASCELGDILFAYVHSPRTGSPRRNAILFQAKASAKQPYRIHRGEMNQLRLYVDWPDFMYERSSFLTGQKRSITPKAPHSGAQYLLIDDRPPEEPMSGLLGFPGTYPVGCCMPDESLRDHTHLAAELFSLFIFRTGRPFEDKQTAAKKQDWSQVVWDLLEIGVKKSFNRKNSGRRRIPRGVGDTIQMMDGFSFNRASSPLSCNTTAEIVGRNRARSIYSQDKDIPPDNRDGEGNAEEPERGVSIVLIETSERESEG
jgi:hypothetical protein